VSGQVIAIALNGAGIAKVCVADDGGVQECGRVIGHEAGGLVELMEGLGIAAAPGQTKTETVDGCG
jgi:hypothetical protein